ncbi:MAG TPA: hypothetical protein VMU50_18610 [Polyangia bacterium]|nr:hypothetical protein [Polyangia bacterium]
MSGEKMRDTFHRIVLSALIAALAACTSSANVGGDGGGGGGKDGGGGGETTTGTGGGAGTGGAAGAIMGTGGGDADGGGAGDAAPGDGGKAEAGGPHTPVPSLGCGKTNPASGARTIMTGGMTGHYNVTLPANYNPSTPTPLGFGFHGFNNPACGPVSPPGECYGFAALPAITVYMKSLQAGWEGQPEPLAENLQFYHDVLDVMKNEYCVDLARIFIAGVSSGGQFIEQIACRDGASLWQVTAVSAYVDKGADTNCMGTPPVLVTQGATETTVDVQTPIFFAKRNGCSPTPPATYMQNLADMKAAFNMGKADYRCMDWDGCTLNPVRYCISSQMTYGGLTHGWPMVGGKLIADFQSTLPK